MNKKTIHEVIQELERTLQERLETYPHQIKYKKLDRDTANHRYQCIDKAIDMLKFLIPIQQNLFENGKTKP